MLDLFLKFQLSNIHIFYAYLIFLMYPSSFECLNHCFGLFVAFFIVFLFCFVHLSCVFLFVHVGVRELTLLFSHLQRQRKTKKVLHNSYHTLLSGLRPYSSPYLSGDRYAPRHPFQLHSSSKQVAESLPAVTLIVRHKSQSSTFKEDWPHSFVHGSVVDLTVH